MTDESVALTFSQRNGYRSLPEPLKVGDLPSKARNQIWNILYSCLEEATQGGFGTRSPLTAHWRQIAKAVHTDYFDEPADEWDPSLAFTVDVLKPLVFEGPFNEVLDLLEFIMRCSACPPYFILAVEFMLKKQQVAYVVSTTDIPTIIPATTEFEGVQILDAMATLTEAGLEGAQAHLRDAVAATRRNDWAASIRDSIHAVESVAKQLSHQGASSLGPALQTIEQHGALHPALKDAFKKLYGFTSNEQGIRHALFDQGTANVGANEALFMLGACASFASYLWRKHIAADEL